MPVRLTHLHKSHQPGELAAFSPEETRAIVLAGHGLVEDPSNPTEVALMDVQRAALAEAGTARSRDLDPALRPAPVPGSPVADHLATTTAFERASATPMPGGAAIEVRHASFAADHQRMGDPYMAAIRRVMAEGTPVYASLADDEVARRVMRLDLDAGERDRVAELRAIPTEPQAEGDVGPLDATLAGMERSELEGTVLLLFRERFGRADDEGLRGGIRAMLASESGRPETEGGEGRGIGEGRGEGEDDGRGEDGGAGDPPPPPPPAPGAPLIPAAKPAKGGRTGA